MNSNKPYKIKKLLIISLWMIVISGVVVLLIAAIRKKSNDRLTGIDIKISGVQNEYFISKKDVLLVLEKVNGGKLEKAMIHTLDLTKMENQLKNDPWIKTAELFYDNNNVLQVKITEREPVARLFTVSGASFYIDSSLTRLPLSEKYSARVPMFTSFPTEVTVLKKSDSALLEEVKSLAVYIVSHPFWMAQIDQVNISQSGEFEMIPKLGNQIIRFGTSERYREKFNKLLAFYQQVQSRLGWNKYSVLDVRFRNQVVGVNRDAAEVKADSLRSVQIMKSLIEQAKKNSDDSTKIQLPVPSDNNERINNSRVINDAPDETIQEPGNKEATPVAPVHVDEKPILNKSTTGGNNTPPKHPTIHEKPSTPTEKKVETKPPPTKKEVNKKEEKRIPKAVMPPKSDY